MISVADDPVGSMFCRWVSERFFITQGYIGLLKLKGDFGVIALSGLP